MMGRPNFTQGEVAMKREITAMESGTGKTESIQAARSESTPSWLASPWATQPGAKRSDDSPAPPPTWTRYIDSRLKQFCTR